MREASHFTRQIGLIGRVFAFWCAAAFAMPQVTAATLVIGGGPTADGDEFDVETVTTGAQENPATCRAANGDFVVVFESYGADGDSDAVRGQRYDSGGAAQGGEFQINSYTTFGQQYPTVCCADDGRFVVAWQSIGQEAGSSSRSVHGQRYNSAGTAQGGEFRANTYTTSDQFEPRISCDANGNFVIAWSDINELFTSNTTSHDGDSLGVFGQRFLSDGSFAGGEFQLNSYTTGAQRLGDVSVAPSGQFVIAWRGEPGGDGYLGDVNARRFDSGGAPQGAIFQVNTYTTGGQYYGKIAHDAAGNFIIAWESLGQDGSNFSVQAQRYDSSGNTIGSEFRANSWTTSGQYDPEVAMDADGDFVIVWSSDGQDGYPFNASFGVRGQLYDSAGNKSGAEFEVNQFTTGVQRRAAVSMDTVGGFTVAWQNEFGPAEGVDARMFSIPAPPPSGACPTTPLVGCRTAAKGSIKLTDNTGTAKDKLAWKWTKGATSTLAEFGDPTAMGSTATQTVCLYDEIATTPTLVATIEVDRAGDTCSGKACWKVTGGGTGALFKDKAATSDGVTKLQFNGKPKDKSKISFSAEGANLAAVLPAPISGTEFFDQDTNVLIQLSTSESAACWESTFALPSKNRVDQFADKF